MCVHVYKVSQSSFAEITESLSVVRSARDSADTALKTSETEKSGLLAELGEAKGREENAKQALEQAVLSNEKNEATIGEIQARLKVAETQVAESESRHEETTSSLREMADEHSRLQSELDETKDREVKAIQILNETDAAVREAKAQAKQRAVNLEKRNLRRRKTKSC